MFTHNMYFCICCGYVLWVHTYILWTTRSSRMPTIYTWSSTIPTPQDICCHPQYVTHTLLSTLYTLVLHNMLPTTCDPQHIHMHPQSAPTTCRDIYIVGIHCGCIRICCGSHFPLCSPQYNRVVHNIYRTCICCGQHSLVTHNTYPQHIQNTHNIYPQHIPLYILWVYIVDDFCIYCGCNVFVYIVGTN